MKTLVMPRVVSPPMHTTLSRTERYHVGRWFVGGAIVAFLIPLIGADLLELHHDLYLLV